MSRTVPRNQRLHRTSSGWYESVNSNDFDPFKEHRKPKATYFWQSTSFFRDRLYLDSGSTLSTTVVPKPTLVCLTTYLGSGTYENLEPVRRKNFGRQVRNFKTSNKRWDEVHENVTLRTSYAKFSLYPAMPRHFLSTGTRLLAEASPNML